MKYAILGSGNIGTALARKFAQHRLDVGFANSRGPETLQALARDIGPNIKPQAAHDAVQAEVIFLAVPFAAYKAIAQLAHNWEGKIIVDTMNTLHVSPEERKSFGGLLSSEVVAAAFPGARLVKGFNHLPAKLLGAEQGEGRKQAVFLSSNDADASATVAKLAEELGFAPVQLGKLNQGGVPLHILDNGPGGLIFQDLAKLG